MAGWPYRADIPQRYSANYERYLARGGFVNPRDDILGFVEGMQGNAGDVARFYFFCVLFDQIAKEGLKGDMAELGVYKGNTATLLAKFARRLGSILYLFDTFEGFNKADLKGVDVASHVGFTDTSLAAVRQFVGEQNVRYVQGYFPETTAQVPSDSTYCLVHLDCDLYAPMMSALQYFYPRLVPGGFLIMHDYGSLHWRGAEKAVDEFFAAKSDAVIPLPDTAGSVVVRKPRISDPCENWLVRRLNNILSREWVDVENGLTELLGNGWAGAEPWGIWGLEGLHELKLFLPRPHIEKVQLDVDAHVYLGPGRSQKVVDVWAENEKIASWTFTREQNRAVRSLHIPPSVILNPDRKAPAISIEFRPDSAEPPSSLDSSTKDSRPLGMGLHRVRRLI